MTAEIEIPDEVVEAYDDGEALGVVHNRGLTGWPLRAAAIRAGLDAVVPLLRARWEAEQRDGFSAQVRDALQQLDGSTASAVALLTGMTRDEIDQVGGVASDGGEVSRG